MEDNIVDIKELAESKAQEESATPTAEEIKYGIGTIINDYEDWCNFVDVLNSVKLEGEEPTKYEALDPDEAKLPNFVALETFTKSEFKEHYDKNELVVGDWENIERIIKLMDAGYLITLGRV